MKGMLSYGVALLLVLGAVGVAQEPKSEPSALEKKVIELEQQLAALRKQPAPPSPAEALAAAQKRYIESFSRVQEEIGPVCKALGKRSVVSVELTSGTLSAGCQ